MKTRADLIARTAKVLGVLASGQSLSAEDSQAIDDEIDGVIEQLSRSGVVYIPDPDNIDDAYLHPLAIILADATADAFGTAIDPTKVFQAKATFRRIQATADAGDPIEAQYF